MTIVDEILIKVDSFANAFTNYDYSESGRDYEVMQNRKNELIETLQNAFKAKEDEIAALRRQFQLSHSNWDMWKKAALEYHEKLMKYEPGSPMLLNNEVSL